jgi:hypothetical protein
MDPETAWRDDLDVMDNELISSLNSGILKTLSLSSVSPAAPPASAGPIS